MTPERPDWLYEELRDLREQHREAHARLRTDMNAGFAAMTQEMRWRSERLDDHSQRLVIIETERKGEQSQAMKRGTWAALLGAAGLTAAWEGWKKMAGW